RTQMDFLALEKGGNIFLITSATPGEGKTTTAINFAISYAQTNKRTLLIDCDMRKPTIYRIFGIDREPGVTDILLGNYNWEECIRTMTDIMLGKFDMEDMMLTPGLDNLSILTTGNIPPNPSELLNSPRMTEFLENLRQEYDFIILDTPPLLPVTDAAVLGTRADGCVLVYRAGAIARGALKRAKLQLDNVRANVWGIVLNSMRAETSTDLDSFRYQSSYYYGGYVEEASEDSLANLPFYERWYHQVMDAVFSSEDEDVVEEASTLSKAIGAVLVALSFTAVGAGMAWQAGINIPAMGSLGNAVKVIGSAPGDALKNLDKIWENAHKGQLLPTPTSNTSPPAVEAPSVEKEKISKIEIPATDKASLETSSKPGVRAAISPIQLASSRQEDEVLKSPPLPAKEGPEVNRLKSNSDSVTMLKIPPMPPATELLKRPYSIVFSINSLHKTTRQQMAQLLENHLAPSFAPVKYPKGPLDRVFLGAFKTRKEARAEMEKYDIPQALRQNGPIIQELPYALQIGWDMSPDELEVIRVILKSIGLHVYFDDVSNRMLLGAFKSSTESQAAANLLTRENIPHRLITR
ncbi:MAG: CpsD/CapB family tyrosine-protein kinase, partial [Nitrospinaceae bacterium]|nr:CpsD/CapB family tyrosine-protein kinase [Nitrospinaceae bacterium]